MGDMHGGAVRNGIGTPAGAYSSDSPIWRSAPAGDPGGDGTVPSGVVAPVGSIAGVAVAVLRAWRRRARQRRALALISDHLLRDIGITRDEASREAAKPFGRL